MSTWLGFALPQKKRPLIKCGSLRLWSRAIADMKWKTIAKCASRMSLVSSKIIVKFNAQRSWVLRWKSFSRVASQQSWIFRITFKASKQAEKDVSLPPIGRCSLASSKKKKVRKIPSVTCLHHGWCGTARNTSSVNSWSINPLSKGKKHHFTFQECHECRLIYDVLACCKSTAKTSASGIKTSTYKPWFYLFVASLSNQVGLKQMKIESGSSRGVQVLFRLLVFGKTDWKWAKMRLVVVSTIDTVI